MSIASQLNRVSSNSISAASGKLGILTPGLGAVSTTMMAGVSLARRGLAKPVGSWSQMGFLPSESPGGAPQSLNSVLSLASLDQLVFGAWDIFPESAYEAAKNSHVLEDRHLEKAREDLEKIQPMSAVFDSEFIRRIHGPHIKKTASKWEAAQALREDIKNFVRQNQLSRVVMVWCASTERYVSQGPVHQSLQAFEQGLQKNDPGISPSMIYAYAALQERVPYANGSPNVSLEIPALKELALKTQTPVAGSDFKTGQTMMKTALAPAFAARLLGVAGWYSTNILGNRDGEVLDDPGSFKSKEVSKLSVLESILDPDVYPDLYKEISHLVRINYYPPRGDNKEGWDNIDIFGWMGYPMQIKVNFLCRDSILAAPIVLDLALFLDLASRSGLSGVQEWMSFFFKSPLQGPIHEVPVHDLFQQRDEFFQTLRSLSSVSNLNLK